MFKNCFNCKTNKTRNNTTGATRVEFEIFNHPRNWIQFIQMITRVLSSYSTRNLQISLFENKTGRHDRKKIKRQFVYQRRLTDTVWQSMTEVCSPVKRLNVNYTGEQYTITLEAAICKQLATKQCYFLCDLILYLDR